MRDAELTAPYMHDGSLKTLEEVVEHYDKGGTPNPSLDTDMKKLNLTTQEKADLVAFMKALTGEHKSLEELLPRCRPVPTVLRPTRGPRHAPLQVTSAAIRDSMPFLDPGVFHGFRVRRLRSNGKMIGWNGGAGACSRSILSGIVLISCHDLPAHVSPAVSFHVILKQRRRLWSVTAGSPAS